MTTSTHNDKIDALERELDAAKSKLARQSEQIDALIKRGNELARYVAHTRECDIYQHTLYGFKGDTVACTCGLNELLSGGDCTQTATPLKSPADS